ncbi:MAG: alpha-galactosidase [Treponema sp.]|nr:alpha-galactosidase [Treponema sp.]
MKILRYVLGPEKKPSGDGILPLDAWELPELLEIAGAGDEARAAFKAGPVALQSGGWQSWSPGWELAPGETFPSGVKFYPALRKMSSPPWDCGRNGNAPVYPGREGDLRRGEVTGSFIMYLRAGDWYLVLAEGPAEAPPKSGVGGGPAVRPPLCFHVNAGRQRVRVGLYCPGLSDGAALSGAPPAALHVFLARGYFTFKDTIKNIYRGDRQERFKALSWLGNGRTAAFRPGGYESWYNHYTEINEKLILEDLEGLGKTGNLIKLRYLDKKQPAVFQIDDGWEKAVGDWEVDESRFPRGLKPIAERIEGAGLIPGIWLAPFLVTRRCRIFREKPKWVLREKDAFPATAGWNPHWDGTFYCLDLSREDVLDYLRSLMDKVIDQWGFRYIKLDFLYTGFFYGAFAGGGAPADHYERAISLLTGRTKNAAGRPLAYLGCGLPLGPSYRYFPLSRIGTDTRETWDWPMARFLDHLGRPSAALSLLDTIGRSFMNGTVFINDPDVVFLRSQNCALTETEKECIALVNFLLAGQIMFSDDPLSLNENDLAFTARVNALYDQLEGDEYGAVGLGGNPHEVYGLISRSRKTAGIINLGDRPFLLENAGKYFPPGGNWLSDHRLPPGDRFLKGRPGTGFAPRSVSIYRY